MIENISNLVRELSVKIYNNQSQIERNKDNYTMEQIKKIQNKNNSLLETIKQEISKENKVLILYNDTVNEFTIFERYEDDQYAMCQTEIIHNNFENGKLVFQGNLKSIICCYINFYGLINIPYTTENAITNLNIIVPQWIKES